jgi:hypothetical protein
MRALLVSLLLLLGGAGPAGAQSPQPHGRIESPTLDPARVPAMDAADRSAERGGRRPSGYWTGYKPAQTGAYRWPLVLVGVGVTGLTILVLVLYLRKVGRERDRSRATSSADSSAAPS